MALYSSFKRINSEAIVDGSVTQDDIASGAVTTAKIADGAINNIKIENGVVTSGKLNNNMNLSTKTVIYRSITNADINNNAIGAAQLAAGAAVDNIGYNPVNKAGDTLTGQLVVQNGSVIAGSNGRADSGVRISADTIQLREAGTDRLAFNSSGQPVESSRPAWMASGRGGWRYGNQYDGANNWRELDNIGWNWTNNGGVTQNNNCRATVPVAGYYYAYLQGYWYNDSNSTNGYTHWNIALNASNGQLEGGRTPHTMYAYGLRNNHAPGIMVSFIRYMNAGQYLTPRPYFGGNQGRVHGNHMYFCGYLIG